MKRDQGRTVVFLGMTVVIMLTLYIVVMIPGYPTVTDRFEVVLKQPAKFPRLPSNVTNSSIDKCQIVENYLNGELVEWSNYTHNMIGKRKKTTVDEFIRMAEDYYTTHDIGVCDEITNGYFMNNKDVTIVFANNESNHHHYRMRMIQFALDENITKIHMDELRPIPSIDPVRDEKTIFATRFPYAFSGYLYFPMTVLMWNILKEKRFIQPYFRSMGLETWFFYLYHFLNGALQLTIVLLITTLLMWTFEPRINYSLFLFVSFIFTLGATAFVILVSTIVEGEGHGEIFLPFLWFPGIFFDYFVPKYLPPHPSRLWTMFFNLNINYSYQKFFAILINATKSKYGIQWFQIDVKAEEPMIVYISFILFDTIWMIVMALFWDDIGNYAVHLYERLRYGSSDAYIPLNIHEMEEDSYLDRTVLGCEDIPMRKDMVTGVKLTNAVKVYPTGCIALDNVTLRALKGQVTCLLGANGSGKTTVFSMITRIGRLTNGSVVSYGDNIGEGLIGYCPQYDPLFDELTVVEHLKLVVTLKGSKYVDFDKESTELLIDVGLNEKRDALARDLSGGMKRKLSFCMAFMGGSQILLLDEPTAGVDPTARKNIQKLLKSCKDRTIMFATHYMEETEAVADWIFVLTHGKLAAAGTTTYLKRKFFDGFLTNVVVSNQQPIEKSIENMKALFQHFIPGSSLKLQRGYQLDQLEMYIPNEAKKKFSEFLELLEDVMRKKFSSPKLVELSKTTQADMTVITFDLSETTLEQVFMVISNQMDEVYREKSDEKAKEDKCNALIQSRIEEPVEGVLSYIQQLKGLIIKHLVFVTTHKIECIGSMLTSFGIIIDSVVGWTDSRGGISRRSLADIKQGVVVMQFNGTRNQQILDYLGTFNNLDIKVEPFSTNMLESVFEYNETLRFVMHVSANHNAIYYSNGIEYAVEILSDFLGNLLYLKSPTNPRIEDNKLNIGKVILHQKGFDDLHNIFMAHLAWAFLSIFIPAINYLIQERGCEFDHLQKLTSVSPYVMFAGNIIHESMMYLLLVAYTYITFFSLGMFSGQFLLLTVCFILLFLGMMGKVHMFSTISKSQDYIFLLLLGYYYVCWNFNWYSHPLVIFRTAIGKIYYSPVDNPEKYQSVRKHKYDFNTLWGTNGVYVQLMQMLLFFVVCTTLYFLLTSQKWRVTRFRRMNKREEVLPSTNTMTKNYKAVENERKFIEENNGEPKDCAVVVDNLIQQYGKFRAVNGISFTVRTSECFGVIGVNGAGKTTTFDIMTGKTLSRGGKVMIGGVDVDKEVNIGYCPQFDSIMDHLTGSDCLYLFARLHRYKDVEKVVGVLLECLGMTEHCEKQLKQMSGGQKRRISIGIALLSRSQCMILDEPTTGIDPIARRELWNVLKKIQQGVGTSILLTSHSMDECQVLCDRITVLQKGEMIALGTSQEYMTEYGDFFIVVFVVVDPTRRESVVESVLKSLKDSQLYSDPHQLNIYFKWKKQKDDKWSAKFGEVAKLADQLKCDDFMLTQATLEDAIIELTGGHAILSEDVIVRQPEGDGTQTTEGTQDTDKMLKPAEKAH